MFAPADRRFVKGSLELDIGKIAVLLERPILFVTFSSFDYCLLYLLLFTDINENVPMGGPCDENSAHGSP
jgi:hypothetical protein